MDFGLPKKDCIVSQNSFSFQRVTFLPCPFGFFLWGVTFYEPALGMVSIGSQKDAYFVGPLKDSPTLYRLQRGCRFGSPGGQAPSPGGRRRWLFSPGPRGLPWEGTLFGRLQAGTKRNNRNPQMGGLHMFSCGFPLKTSQTRFPPKKRHTHILS